MVAYIEHRIKISVEELIANKDKWEDLINSYVDDAKQSLMAEIFLNGEVIINQYLRRSAPHKPNNLP